MNQDTEPEWELFDMVADPHEMRNVYAEPRNKKVVAELKVELNRLRRECQDNDS